MTKSLTLRFSLVLSDSKKKEKKSYKGSSPLYVIFLWFFIYEPFVHMFHCISAFIILLLSCPTTNTLTTHSQLFGKDYSIKVSLSFTYSFTRHLKTVSSPLRLRRSSSYESRKLLVVPSVTLTVTHWFVSRTSSLVTPSFLDLVPPLTEFLLIETFTDTVSTYDIYNVT